MSFVARIFLVAASVGLLLAGCRSEPLAPDGADGMQSLTTCEKSGGRCVARPTSGPQLGVPQCDADEIVFQPLPLLCSDISEDCCVPACPVARPDSGGACHTGASCQYREDAACIQAICFDGHWWLSVMGC